ncbi:delta(14)-sterol reductase-like [Herrania umbratica]|uniref:Delta(14)-sterol reductase n=1 Tax=Herrania umbratica TaxID=108875 RepID=A0A6J1AMP8_9ROSI|nr:delta(14)-sterol reductase-like [Herrania umbratica]
MELGFLLHALIPSWNSVGILAIYLAYIAIASFILPAKVVPGMIMQDGTRLHYRCNGLLTLLSLIGLLGLGSKMNLVSPTLISDRGLELLSASFIFSFPLTTALYIAGCRCSSQASSLKPNLTGDLILDWYMGVQLNPHFMGIDLKFFFLRAGMMGWILINLSNLAKSVQTGTLSLSMILYQLFCLIHVMEVLYHEEQLTSNWDIMVERLGFMLVGGFLVWAAFMGTIQGWWLLHNRVELSRAAAIATCLIYLIGVLGYRGANKQKHTFKKNPKALIWGKPPKVIGGKLLASGYWGIARHYNYFGDFLLSLSFSLTCGISSPIPYIYPICLVFFFVSRERRDEARCAEKYKEIWAEYFKVVPWRIKPYLY